MAPPDGGATRGALGQAACTAVHGQGVLEKIGFRQWFGAIEGGLTGTLFLEETDFQFGPGLNGTAMHELVFDTAEYGSFTAIGEVVFNFQFPFGTVRASTVARDPVGSQVGGGLLTIQSLVDVATGTVHIEYDGTIC